ncbi:MAG: M16 family metallopeptidase [Gemmatimonadaceae bacterium]
MRLLSAALLAASLAAPVVAQQRAATTEPTVPAIPFTKYVLNNGLTLIVHEDHKVPIAAINVWYHVGSKNEKFGKTGFAHLFEHLMFNGSENFKDDYFKAVEPIGATDLNGTTNNDRTNYFQNVPLSAIDRVLWLESDRMGHLLGAVDQKVLDEQRGVVQNEKRQGENEPYGKMWITMEENTYPRGHPYSWSVIGSMDDLGAASLDDVKEWFRTYYGPSNATIVVAGDVKPEDIKARVEKFFGDIPPGPPIIKQTEWIAKRTGVHRQVMQDRVPQARVVKSWNVPGLGAPDEAALTHISRILGEGKTSRLYKRLVYNDRTASSIVTYYDNREIGGQLVVWADVQPGGDLKRVERAMDEEVARFLREGPTIAELNEAKVNSRATYIRGMERIGGFGGKSDLLAQGQVYMNDPDFTRKRVIAGQRVSVADVHRVAQRWLSDGMYVLEVQPFADLSVAQAGAERTKMPDVAQPPAIGFPTAEKATLSNGLKVQLVRRTAVPVVSMRLLLDAGYAADKGVAPGTAQMTLSMLDEGTTTRTSQQISNQLAALGAEIFTGSAVDNSRVTLYALRDKLDPALAIFSDVVLNPSFPQGDLDREKQVTIANIQQEKAQPISIALRVLPLLLYGPGHAYGTPLTGSGTEESAAGMTREQLRRFHQTWFKPNNAAVIVVGDITMAELVPKLEGAFSSWRSGAVPTKAIADVTPKSRGEVYILDRPDAEQTLIIAAQLAPPKRYASEFAFQSFNDAFGGAFVSRLNMNLREDKHWSYGAGAFPFDARGQRLWISYAPVQTDKTKESLQEVVRELSEVTSSKPITPEELADATDRQTLTLAGRWETGLAVLNSLMEITTFGLPENYYSTFAERVRAVTPQQVAASVTEVMRPNAMVWVVVGDRAKIEAGVRSLNLGEVRFIDADGMPKTPTP